MAGTYENKNTKISSEGLMAIYVKICNHQNFLLYGNQNESKLPTFLVSRGQTPFHTKGKGLGHGHRASRYLISHVNPVMTSAMAIAKVRLATFMHSRF